MSATATPPRFCTYCGAELESDSMFCTECGKRRPDTGEPASARVAATSPKPKPAIVWSVVGLLIALVLAGSGAWVFRDRLFPSPPPAADTVILTDPVGAFDEPSSGPPEQVAYVHFLDEVHNRLKGRLSVGSPTITPGRIEISLTTDGRRETLVVIEKENDGRAATVLVGPKDAGAIRSYTLTRNGQGWQITGFQDLDG